MAFFVTVTTGAEATEERINLEHVTRCYPYHQNKGTVIHFVNDDKVTVNEVFDVVADACMRASRQP